MYFCCAIFGSSRLLNEILSRDERLQLDGNGNLIHLSIPILAPAHSNNELNGKWLRCEGGFHEYLKIVESKVSLPKKLFAGCSWCGVIVRL